MVRGTFQTDPISALGLPPPVSIGKEATVGAALAAVQERGQGYVLVVDQDVPLGIMSERDVLMKIVARQVKYSASVLEFMSDVPARLMARDPIARAVALIDGRGIDNIPVIDDDGRAVGVVRTLDIIHFLAEAFPEQVLNLPPRPHQALSRPEGA